MGLQWKDRVWEESATTGTGTYTLDGAKAANYQAFSEVGDGEQAPYMATDGTDFEIGVGTWNTGGTLTRDQILESSNAGAAVNWSAGDKDIILCLPAEYYTALVEITQNQNFQGTYVVSGSVAWDTGLDFEASAHVYFIDGLYYEAPAVTVSLAAADATNPRIDVIVATDGGTITKVTGTPAASPAKPEIADGQVELTFVTVEALATAPAITTEDIYLEDTEWVTTEDAEFTSDSTNDFYQGSKCVEATAAGTSDQILFTNGADFSMNGVDFLEFHIKSKATWPANKRIQMRFSDNSDVAVGNWVRLYHGSYGFDSSDTTNWQVVTIPKSAFGVGTSDVRKFTMDVRGGGAAIGFYVDQIRLQTGVSTTAAQPNIESITDGTNTYIITQSGETLEFSGADINPTTGVVTINPGSIGAVGAEYKNTNFTAESDKVYVTDASAEMTLPATSALGDVIFVHSVVQTVIKSNASASAQSVRIAGEQSPISSSESINLYTCDAYSSYVLFCTVANSEWDLFKLEGTGSLSVTLNNRGIMFGSSGDTDMIEYFDTTSEADSVAFGDLTDTRYNAQAVGSTTRSVLLEGTSGTATWEYITLSSTGNSADFGDPDVGNDDRASMSSDTRGVEGCGNGNSDAIEYLTIASTGDGTDFGNATEGRDDAPGGAGSKTRGLMFGGHAGAYTKTIDYISISSIGDAIDFGDQLLANGFRGAGSNNVKAIHFGDHNSGDPQMELTIIASLGDSTVFGDLPAISNNSQHDGTANETRCLMFGWELDQFDFCNFASLGDSTTFGDCAATHCAGVGAVSGAHGGLY